MRVLPVSVAGTVNDEVEFRRLEREGNALKSLRSKANFLSLSFLRFLKREGESFLRGFERVRTIFCKFC